MEKRRECPKCGAVWIPKNVTAEFWICEFCGTEIETMDDSPQKEQTRK